MKETRPQLTISLLISNRIETIPRCLNSLRPIMEAIPCELILTDTSKNVDVHNLLLEYTDKVYEFDWCNDFAKARNLGLEKATGEWFMFLDDDEWFVDTTALIDFFQSGEYKNYNYASYQVRNFKDSKYIYFDDCWLARLFCIETDSHFERKIHEQFTPLQGREKTLPALVCHSGYIFDTLEERRMHFARNRKLLLDMMQEEPDNIYWWLQLAQEYSYANEQEKLVAYCKECLEKLDSIDTEYVNNKRGVFYTGFVSGCIRLKRYEEATEVAKVALEDSRTGKVLEAMMYLRVAEAYLFSDKLVDAKEAVLKYLDIGAQIDLNAPEIMEQVAVFLAGEAFNKNSYEIAYAILICCDLKQGNTDALKAYYDRLGWSNSVVYTMERIEEIMIPAMWNLPYEPIFMQVMVDVFNKDNLRMAFRKEILLHKKELQNNFLEHTYALAKFMQKVIDGLQDTVYEYREILRQYVQAVSSWCDMIEAEGLLGNLEEETPSYVQAAVYIAEYLELESKDAPKAIRKLKAAVETLPELARGIGSFLERYKELRIGCTASGKEATEAKELLEYTKVCIERNDIEALVEKYEKIPEDFEYTRETATLEVIFKIYKKEKETESVSFLDGCSNVDELLDRYERLKLYLRRFDFNIHYDVTGFMDFIIDNHISSTAISFVVNTSIIHKKEVLNEVAESFLKLS